MFSKIIVNSPWYYFLVSMALAFCLSAWLYLKNRKTQEVPAGMLRMMFVVRFLSFTLIFLLLLSILFKRLKTETENPAVLIAIDNSSSMTAMDDSAFVKGAFLSRLKALKEAIGDKFEVKTILFGNRTAVTNDPPRFTEKETDIDNLIADLENNYSNQNIGALVIASDGIYNKGANPAGSAEKLGYPVYSIAMGDTNISKDILVQKINHNQVAYLGNNFPVEVVLGAKKYAGKEVEVGIYQNGVIKTKQTVKVSSGNFLSTCNFTLEAGTAGMVKYTVKASVMEDEKNRVNNQRSFVMEVINNKEKILLLANVPHPDVSALQESVLNSTNYEMECVLAAQFKGTVKPYSLVILHGYSANQAALANDCRNNRIPCWIINPVSFENIPGVKISALLNRVNDAEPTVRTSFGLFTISPELKNFVKDLPAVKTPFGNYGVLNGANALISQRIGEVETENPVLVFADLNGYKSAAFIGDGLWKWKLRDFAEHGNHNLFRELVGKSIQYLSVKSDKSFFRITSPKLVNENEPIELGAEVYNKSYELITDPDVMLVVTNSENKKFNYTFSKASNSYKLNIGLLPPGEYSYDASVKLNGEVLVKKGLITVKEVISEAVNTVANHRMLFQLSNQTGGKLFYPAEIDKLQKEILMNERIKPVTYSQTATTALIDWKYLFLIILVLLTTEWFFRKRYLTI